MDNTQYLTIYAIFLLSLLIHVLLRLAFTKIKCCVACVARASCTLGFFLHLSFVAFFSLFFASHTLSVSLVLSYKVPMRMRHTRNSYVHMCVNLVEPYRQCI